MHAVLNRILPHPVRYHEVWRQQRGSVLYAWEPVPISPAFVALGMIVTRTPDPPALDAVRTVPKHWCFPSSTEPRKVWEDAGAAGGRRGSMWVVNSLELMAVADGHTLPKDRTAHTWSNFQELTQREFHLSKGDLEATDPRNWRGTKAR